MDLFTSAWMTRSLGESVSALHLEQDGGVFAGGWDGCLKHWNAEGELMWSAILPDRITVLDIHDNTVFATAGLHIVSLEATTGDQRWSYALEGSADSLYVFEEHLYAISSVYDIEHNDFLESAVWNFSFDGTMNWIQRMDERPWTLLEFKGKLWFGLGRPKCGFSTIDSKGKVTHASADTDSPITCGSTTTSTMLFGHANGAVSNHKGKVIFSEQSAIEFLYATPKGYVVALEDGTVLSRKGKAEVWSSDGDAVTVQARGFSFQGHPTHWACRWSGSQGNIEIRNIDSGELLMTTPSERCESIASDSTRLALGFENGQIRLWEASMFERRMLNGHEAEEKDERKSALQEKLSALRDR